MFVSKGLEWLMETYGCCRMQSHELTGWQVTVRFPDQDWVGEWYSADGGEQRGAVLAAIEATDLKHVRRMRGITQDEFSGRHQQA